MLKLFKEIPQTPQRERRRPHSSRTPATPATREQHRKRVSRRVTPPMHQLSQDGGDDIPFQPMRLFQNEIAQVTNPVNDVFNMPLTRSLHIGGPAIGAQSQNNNENPSLDDVPIAQNTNAIDPGLENHVPARIIANRRIADPRGRGTGNRPPNTRPKGRQPHPQHPDLLYCTSNSHYVKADLFGPGQFLTCSACREKNRQRANRLRQNAQNIIAEQQLQDQLNNGHNHNHVGDGQSINAQPTVEDIPDEEHRPQSPVNNNVPVDPLQQSAVSPEEKQQLEIVRQKIIDIRMEHCVYCHEKWFDLKLKDGKCSKCQKGSKFQVRNKMYPGIVPPALPQLSQMEEMIISPVHALVQLWQVKGGQYKYTGHICNFPRENAVMVAKVPLLPEDCDIIIMRRAGTNNVTNEQIFRDFRVRRGAIQQWLEYLENNHSAFRNQGGDVQVDYNLLNQLPEDNSVHDRIRTIEVGTEEDLVPENVGPQQDNDQPINEPDLENPPIYSAGFVPNVNVGITEMQQLQAAAANDVDNPIILTMPHIRGTPINENMNIPIASNAFPSLFPTGQADFTAVRDDAVTMSEWTAHLLRLEDG